MTLRQPDHTIVYKSVGSLHIPMDIYLPKHVKNAPILLWFHGGGLIQGRRDLLAPHMRNGVEEYGYACISADYRLAPQVHVKDILEDVKDCIKFIRSGLSGRLGEGLLDTSRLAVSGSSAGGYLALLSGLYVDPKPKVILPIYPITDPLGSFFTTRQPTPKGRVAATTADLTAYLDPRAPAISGCDRCPPDPRSNIYVYMMRFANLAQLLGIPDEESAEPYRISRRIHEFRLPPAYIAHGDDDKYVGVEQADEVVGAMMGCGLTVEYERPHGKDHAFDNDAEYKNKAMYEFMLRYL